MHIFKFLKNYRKAGRKMLFILVCLGLSIVSHATVVTYPQLSGMQGCQYKYSLFAKDASDGSAWKKVSLYNVVVAKAASTVTENRAVEVNTTVGNFDCDGPVDIKIAYSESVASATVYPASLNITPVISGDTITFTITGPQKFYVDITDYTNKKLHEYHYENCFHIIANSIEVNPPLPDDPNVIFIATGTFKNSSVNVPEGKTLYIQGGAAVNSVNLTSNTKLLGRGFIYRAGYDAISASYMSNVVIDGIIDINHGWGNGGGNGIRIGQSKNIRISNTVSFSSRKWGDGYNVFCSDSVFIDNVFVRTNDDAITFYGGGKTNYKGDNKNIFVTNSTLLPDLAHSFNVGVYGADGEEIRDITVSNIDAINWCRTGNPAISFNVSANVRAANIRFNNIRVNDCIKRGGGLFNIRTGSYDGLSGKAIDSIYFTNVTYNGPSIPPSSIDGYNATRKTTNIFFENLVINNVPIHSASAGKFSIGSHASNVLFDAPQFTSLTTVIDTIGASVSYQITATNSPTAFSATGLPVGFSLDTITGIISGIPTTSGKFTSAIYATNAYSTNSSKLTITINPSSTSPVFNGQVIVSGDIGSVFTYAITATNSPVSFNATDLPSGLSVDTLTGVISGTPSTSGMWTVSISATNASGTGTGSITLGVSSALPSPWQHTDIGFVSPTGNVTHSSSTFTINGVGAGFGGISDAFQYIYQPYTGDGQIVARITSEQSAGGFGQAGVMIRESLAENSAYVTAYLTPQKQVKSEYRAAKGDSVINNKSISTSVLPYWLKITRIGDSFTTYRSGTGNIWVQMGSKVTVPMEKDIYIGLPVCSQDSITLYTTKYNSVSVSAIPTVGVEDERFNKLEVYPSPVTDILTIRLPASATNVAKVVIYNSLGELVGFKYFERSIGTVDMSGFSSGIYIVKIFDGQSSMYKKVIKQ